MKTKSLLASKTFWVNIIMAILAVCATIKPDLLDSLGINSAKVMTVIIAITGLLNIFLRVLTNTAITGTAPTTPPATNV